MIDIFCSKEIKDAETKLFSQGVTPRSLIEKASRGLFDTVKKFSKIAIVIGSGNNGSDGGCLGLILADEGIKFDIYKVWDIKSLELKTIVEELTSLGVEIKNGNSSDFNGYDCIVDCIFGIGLTRTVEGEYAEIINKINASNAYVVSADIPSGLSTDSGEILGVCVKADLTISFSGAKLGYFLGSGVDVVGEIKYVDTGIIPQNPTAKLFTDFTLRKRKNNTHKGSYGKVSYITGSARFVGASLLAERSAHAALRSGAGLVNLCVPYSLREVYASRVLESTLTFIPDDGDNIIFDQAVIDNILEWSDVIVLGMGLGVTNEVQRVVEYVIKKANVPLVIDADALNVISRNPSILSLGKDITITPHIGEFARLLGKSIKEINPLKDSVDFAKKHEITVHLKGFTSITALSCGEIYFCNSGCPAMAKGGSGDVLSGIMGAFIAQKINQPILSAVLTHGEAGKIASVKFGEYGVLARDIADSVPQVLKNHISRT